MWQLHILTQLAIECEITLPPCRQRSLQGAMRDNYPGKKTISLFSEDN